MLDLKGVQRCISATQCQKKSQDGIIQHGQISKKHSPETVVMGVVCSAEHSINHLHLIMSNNLRRA